MAKAKKEEIKKVSPIKKVTPVKAVKPTKKIPQTKPQKEKPVAKVVKKAVKSGLVKAPKAAPSPKVKIPPPPKKSDEQKKADKKEKLKRKRLEKKLKKSTAKDAATENGQDTKSVGKVSAPKGKIPEKQVKENGAKTEDVKKDVAIGKKSARKNNKKAKNTNSDGNKKPRDFLSEHTVFVGNLPSNTKRVQLAKLFSEYGPTQGIRFRTANGKVIFKHKMRQQSGSLNAYVILKDEESVAKSLALNGVEFKGNHLRVTKSDKAVEQDPKRMVFVGNLKYTATDDKLRQIFSSCGEIEYVRTLGQAEKNGCNGTAFVCFKNPDSVGLALELKGTVLDERPIHVERYLLKKLGAKDKRVAEEQKAKAQGPRKGKKPDKKTDGTGKKTANTEAETEDGKKKKSEFRGVKTDAKKKDQKKKVPNEMKRLAKKIAPRSDE